MHKDLLQVFFIATGFILVAVSMYYQAIAQCHCAMKGLLCLLKMNGRRYLLVNPPSS